MSGPIPHSISTNLNKLSIWIGDLSVEHLISLFQANPNLKELKVDGTFSEIKRLHENRMKALARAPLNQLQKLSIHTKLMTDKELLAIVENTPDLRSLDIQNCDGITGNGIASVLRLCPRLEIINIPNILEKVKEVSYSGNNLDEMFARLRTYPNAGKLNISNMNVPRMTTPPGTYPRIDILQISHSTMIDSELMVQPHIFPHLKTIALEKVEGLTDSGIIAFRMEYPHIHISA